MRRARGFTVVEVVMALGVLTILLTAALGGEEAHKRAIAHAFEDLEAHLAASSRLEALADPSIALRPGEHDLDLGLADVRTRETVTALGEGLYEVRVVVRAVGGGILADLTTLVVREARP